MKVLQSIEFSQFFWLLLTLSGEFQRGSSQPTKTPFLQHSITLSFAYPEFMAVTFYFEGCFVYKCLRTPAITDHSVLKIIQSI